MRRALLLALAVVAAPAAACSAELVLQFPDLADGTVFFAVHGSAESWARRQAPAASGRVAVVARQALATVELPPGDYAVMAFLDRNGDGRLDTLPIGLPVEPYGFSNNSRGSFGPPRWARARFALPAGGARQLIRLR